MIFIGILFSLHMLLAAAPAAAESAALPDSSQFSLTQLSELLDSSRYEDVLTIGAEALSDTTVQGTATEARVLEMLVLAGSRSAHVMSDLTLKRAEEVIALKETLFGPQSAEVARSLGHLGALQNKRGDFPASRESYNRAIAIMRSTPAADQRILASLLSGHSLLCKDTGAYREALDLAEEALLLHEKTLGSEHPELANTLNCLGIVHGRLGEYQLAIESHKRALHIRETALGPDHEWVAESLNNLSIMQFYAGDYEASTRSLIKAIAILKVQLGPDNHRFWQVYGNLGLNYLDMGDFVNAQQTCAEALANVKRLLGPDHYDVCYALDALASAHYGLGEFDIALVHYRESMRIMERDLGPRNPETLDTRKRIGLCLAELDSLDAAAENLNESLDLGTVAVGPDSPQLCEILQGLASVRLRQHRYREALDFATRTADILRQNLGDRHPILAAVLLQKAEALQGLGQTDETIDIALTAERISREHLRTTMSVLSEDQALKYADSRTAGLDLAQAALNDSSTPGQVERVWDAVIRSRAVVLDAFSLNKRNLGETDIGTSSQSAALREKLANLVLRGPDWYDIEGYRLELDETRAQLAAVEQEIAVSGSRQSGSIDAGHGLQDVHNALQPGAALLAFSRYRKNEQFRYRAYVMSDSQAQPETYDLGEASRIEDGIRAWRDQIVLGDLGPENGARGFIRTSRNTAGNLQSYRTGAEALRRMIWDEPAAGLDKAKRVFLVPDGSLFLVNFASLPTDNSRFLVESGPALHLLDTERTLCRAPQATDNRRLLAVGNPDYDLDLTTARTPLQTNDENAVLAGFHFKPLPHAGREIRELEDLWSRSLPTGDDRPVILEGAQATETALKTHLPDIGILHLATHGFFITDTDAGKTAGPTPDTMINSGMALAGANNWRHNVEGHNDGLLTAAEVSAWNLCGLGWAVLSACETGIGTMDVQGEGVFGLRRAFMLAGARSVIMSLWPVQDDATRQWMSALYKARLDDRLDTIDSVRSASLDVLALRRQQGLSVHPYYWAGFVAAGDWR
jgi:CHAT domain-containing protein